MKERKNKYRTRRKVTKKSRNRRISRKLKTKRMSRERKLRRRKIQRRKIHKIYKGGNINTPYVEFMGRQIPINKVYPTKMYYICGSGLIVHCVIVFLCNINDVDRGYILYELYGDDYGNTVINMSRLHKLADKGYRVHPRGRCLTSQQQETLLSSTISDFARRTAGVGPMEGSKVIRSDRIPENSGLTLEYINKYSREYLEKHFTYSIKQGVKCMKVCPTKYSQTSAGKACCWNYAEDLYDAVIKFISRSKLRSELEETSICMLRMRAVDMGLDIEDDECEPYDKDTLIDRIIEGC